MTPTLTHFSDLFTDTFSDTFGVVVAGTPTLPTITPAATSTATMKGA